MQPDSKKPHVRPSPEDLENELDEGLKDTFPASDPPSVTRATRTGAPGEFAMRKNKMPNDETASTEEEQLDQGLMDTFPASDPPSVTYSMRPGRPRQRE